MARFSSEYDSSEGIRKILKSIYMRLERDELSVQKAKALSSIAYQILATIQESRKEAELEAVDKLQAELEKLGG